MAPRNRLKNPRALTWIGVLLLLLSPIWRWTDVNVAVDVRDAATGFLCGVSVGCLLLGLTRSGCRRSTAEDGPCT